MFAAFSDAAVNGPLTFVGSVTASKYDVELNGVFNQAGQSYPPGASGGTQATGGQVN